MNLESLRQRILSATTTVTLSDGAQVRLAKLNAADGIAIGKEAKALADSGASADELVPFYKVILSKSIIDEKGKKQLDSEEGRELLGQLPRDDFMLLGDAAAEWNLGESKKNSPPTSDSPTSSASLSVDDTHTPTTC